MRSLLELYTAPDRGGIAVNKQEQAFVIPGYKEYREEKLRVHILALGDVGGILALALRLTGGDIVGQIGVYDIDEKVLQRWEQELNQIALPAGLTLFPPVVPLQPAQLFACDVFVFCASRGVADVSQTDVDVRMMQLEKNLTLVRDYAGQAVERGFDGEFFVVSDPVDPLCKGAVAAGLSPKRVQGFGLGVMNGRAAYYARQAAAAAERDGTALNRAMAAYLTEGRVFGPHGGDLVVANSVAHYDDAASLRLTELTATANLQIRKLGFKPYIAPAVASGALSISENLRGHWQYSSAWFGGAFLGMRNRRTPTGLQVEDLPLDQRLFARIRQAYRNLERIDG
ncbi:MAG: lactate dehydrogenase [Firmicutes bacterium]|nr:lactate dehydrogenase [Bacillota bacterium]